MVKVSRVCLLNIPLLYNSPARNTIYFLFIILSPKDWDGHPQRKVNVSLSLEYLVSL